MPSSASTWSAGTAAPLRLGLAKSDLRIGIDGELCVHFVHELSLLLLRIALAHLGKQPERFIFPGAAFALEHNPHFAFAV
jgi:hypothetical protein